MKPGRSRGTYMLSHLPGSQFRLGPSASVRAGRVARAKGVALLKWQEPSLLQAAFPQSHSGDSCNCYDPRYLRSWPLL
jgi:hypothetical protein